MDLSVPRLSGLIELEVRNEFLLVHVIAGEDVEVDDEDLVVDEHYLIVGLLVIPELGALQEQKLLLVNVRHNLRIVERCVALFFERDYCKVARHSLFLPLQNYLVEVHPDFSVGEPVVVFLLDELAVPVNVCLT